MIKKISFFLFLILSYTIIAQNDFSDKWEDLFSYNDVIDFYQNEEKIIALTDNALFIYNKTDETTEKISSVNGMTGTATGAIYYSESLDKIVVGYENGNLEIIDRDMNIRLKPDIANFDIIGSKKIYNITAHNEMLYLSTAFGIVSFNLDTEIFEDTYFIGENSTELIVYETGVYGEYIFAVTESGLYKADINDPFLVDASRWEHLLFIPLKNIIYINENVYIADDNYVYELAEGNIPNIFINPSTSIKDVTTDGSFISVSANNKILIYNSTGQLAYQCNNSVNEFYNFTANSAKVYQNNLCIASADFGILQSELKSIHDFIEIHPEGPISNEVFSISKLGDDIWVVYGGYNSSFVPFNTRKGASHFNGENWITIPYHQDAITERNLVYTSIDPNHENKVYISSFKDGMVVIENDEVVEHWDDTNTPLDVNEVDQSDIRISDSIFDDEGNLYITNVGVTDRLKKYDINGNWTSYNLNELYNDGWGMKSMVFDNVNNLWIGTQTSGAWALSEGINKKAALTTDTSKGNLPHRNARAIAVDKNNTVWIGTRQGLTTFRSNTSFFDEASYIAQQVIIASGEDDEFGIALLGVEQINSIAVDGADNKWFGTETGGVLYTNPSGKETFLYFDKDNSPLPSNRIMKIITDGATGDVYFATDKGIVKYQSGVAAYAENLQEIYAYPNPVLRDHDFVTIDGRYETHLPEGSNVKILDIAGNLVYETNVNSGQEAFGGKVVWDKTNLAGNKVASGVYIVLVITDDAKETSMTKIAIVN